MFVKGHNSNGSAWEQDPIAFVYVPLTDPRVIAGKFNGGTNNITLQNAPFTVTNPSGGTYRLEIPGHSPSTGVLIISAEGGAGNNVDNPVSFAANGNGWDIETRDLPNMGLQNIGAADAVVSFVFIPGPTPGIKVTPTTGLLTSESGGTATFDVVLDTQPTADVTIPLSSSNTAEGTVSPSSLTFTPANWNTPQTVTITGVDDALSDGAVAYSIVTGPAISADPNYDGRDAANVSVTNADNEVGITINPIAGLTTTEAGGTAVFTVQLNTEPTGDVVIALSSSNPAEGTIAVPSLIFTSANWNTPQSVTVTGVDDFVDDGDVVYSIITAPAVSFDLDYSGINAANVSLTNIDDDTADVTVTPVTGLTTTEAGGTATFTVVLTSQPSANVTIGLTSSNTAEGTVAPSSLAFTPANWNVEQTVTITGVNDLVRDGDIAYSIVTAQAISTDPLYSAINPPDVAVTNLDNEPLVTVSPGAVHFGVGGSAIVVDPFATITEPIATNYNNYQLVATLTSGVDANDRLELRNYGTGADQVGVAGSNVTFGGTTIGSFSGGSGATPLIITFNASATPAIAQAVLRAITFRSVVANPPQVARIASFTVNVPGGGVSNAAGRNIQVGLVRVTDLQEGVDRGTGVYTGQVDTQLFQSSPDVAFPTGGDANGLLVDWPDASVANASQILLRYDNLFGSGPGQIPLGATIVSAELLVNVNNTGDGGTLHRMLTTWNENTDTWNSFGNGTFPRDTIGGVSTDGTEARTDFDSQWGLSDGSGASGTGIVSIGVTRDLEAWAGGEVNHGWVITGWMSRTDGTAFSPSETVNPLLRPRLKVTWLPAGVSTSNFRQGVDGYLGVVDAVVQQAQPDVPFGSDFTLGVDAPAPADEWQTLLRFDDIIGSGPGQIPPGSTVHAAALILASVSPNAMGDGGRFHTMLQSWDTSVTWNSLGNGVQADGIEASTTFNTQAGVATLDPNVQGSFNPFDVTADVQSWVRGNLDNNGWAILPWAGGSDGWFFGSSDTFLEHQRPQLRVFYTTPGVTITPTSGLFTSEVGGTATFTVALDTAPTANVTIPLTSSDTTEGTVAPTSLTFTPANWNIPQTVTITGVDDLLPDGPIAYSIVTGPLTSADPFYNNLDPSDVSVTNVDNETAGVTVQLISSPMVTTEGGGTAQFSIVLNMAPTANVTIGLSSSDLTEGTVVSSVVFTPGNWSVPQIVTITGVNDNQIDGPIAYTIVTAATVSTDPNYNNLPVADVAVTNLDNDVAGLTITPASGLRTTEAGGTATFTVVLNTQPTAAVAFDLASSNTNEGTVSPTTLTFTAANWNVPQTVTLTGVNDALNDGAVDYTIITSVITSADADYNGINPIDVMATNVDVRPTVTLPDGPRLFGFGGPAVLVDFQATVVDLDSLNFNTGTLTIQSSVGGTADDRIEVRNNGTGAGQIGVSGSTVTFGGTPIGTIAGGVGTAPLVITLNAAANQTTTEALLRAVTFRNVSTTFANSTRTLEVVLNDGAGNTSVPVTTTIVVGMRRATSFQEGADVGNGTFVGTSDIELSQTNPDTAYPSGSTSEGLGVVGSPMTANSQVLLRFDNIFGTGPGQIPLGSIITSAYLDLDVNNSGNGPVFRRMLTGWNANTETWNSLMNGVEADGVEARTAVESTLNTASGGSAGTGLGTISVGVTADLQAWSSGEANNGWAIMPFQGTNSDNFVFSPSEAADLQDRPKLRIEWIPAGAATSSFRNGVNGYTGAVDTQLTQNSPTASGATAVDLFVDFTDNVTNPNATHVLLRFDDFIGTALGQVPAGTNIYAAVLTLPGMGSANTPGDGGSFHTMLQPWAANATWSTFSDGVQADGIEASLVESNRAGNESRFPNAQAGYNTYDMTLDVQSWLNGTTDNNGWAILPWVGGSDGWAISSSEVAVVTNRPMLTVYYEAGPNLAPVNTTPVGPISGVEDTNVPFTGANAISVFDADAGTSNLTTTISVPNSTVGTFTASNGGGTATITPSNGGATLTIVGPQTEINLALSTLVFVPAANRNTVSGVTTVTVLTSDGLASDTDTFNITLAEVNDAPSFTKGPDQTVPFNAPAQTVTGWAIAISAGPANESTQTVTFLVTNNNNGLFSAQPAIASNGTLTFTPMTGMSGTAIVTVTAQDNGGTANGGVNQSAPQTFNITVNAGAVNLAPTINLIGGVTINEDAGLQTVNLSGITAGGAETQALTVSASSSNPGLIPNPTVIYTSPNETGSLTYTPVADQFGSATITVTVRDAGFDGIAGNSDDASTITTFTVTVNPVNDRPSFTATNPPAVNEDAPPQTVTSWVTAFNPGPNEGTQTVSAYTVSNVSNAALFAVAPSVATNGTLTYTLAANANGTSTFDVTVTDNGGTASGGLATSLPQTFTITVTGVNDAPSFVGGTNQTVNEDAGPQTVSGFATSISAGPVDEAGQALTFNVTANTNPSLFVVAPSIAANGTLTYTPAANANGNATITYTLSDNGGTANGGVNTSGPQTFAITVNPVNDAPSFTAGPNLTVAFNATAQTISGWATGISAGPADEAGQILTFAVTSNTNPSLFAAAPVVAPNGTLTFTPASGQQGTATITLQLSDNGGTANGGVNLSPTQTFTITVDGPVNVPPTISPIPNVTINEDAGLQTVNLTGITAGIGDVQALQVTASSSNAALIPTPAVSYTSPATTGSLSFTPVADGFGAATITVTVRDAGLDLVLGNADDGFTTTSITVNVTPVNDPPVATDSTFSTLVNTAISETVIATDVDGPALTFAVVIPPALGTLTSFNTSTGEFTYTPAVGATGLDIFSFTVTDGTSTDSAIVRINIRPLTPTVTPSDGNITVTGTGEADVIIISAAGAGQALVRTQANGVSVTGTYPLTGTITVNSGAGRDYIAVANLLAPTVIDAGEDDDYVSTGLGDDLIVGGLGNDTINASGGNNIVWGDEINRQDDAIGGDDVLSSLGGNDIHYGGGGNDQIFPGAGDDYVNAGQGDDIVSGGAGNDRIYGGLGNDVLVGDAGDDIISGNGGNDFISGLDGNDILIGGTGGGWDTINGGQGNDLLIASDTTNSTSSTSGDANDLALMALLIAWNATQAAGLANGIVTASDGAENSLTGSTGDDDFYVSPTDSFSDFNATGMGTDRSFL